MAQKGAAGDGEGSSMVWKNAWATATSYSADDAVENDGSSYICISGHTSSASDEPGVGGSWATYWDLMAQKGDTGATGATGAQGPAGNDGADGATGATGAQGPAGNDGADGATGATGAQGPAGNDGADGATGATGAQGPAGNDGADGTSFTWSNAWATATAFSENDVVENDGSSYICISGHTSSASDEPGVGGSWATYWDLMAQKGDTGATGATGAQGPAGNDGDGAFTADADTQITPSTAIVLDQATGNEVALAIDYTTNKATSGNDTGLIINQTDTASPGTSLLFDAQVSGTTKFSINNAGDASATSFNDVSGTALYGFSTGDPEMTDASGNTYLFASGIITLSASTLSMSCNAGSSGTFNSSSTNADVTSPDISDKLDISNGLVDLQTDNTSRLDITDWGVRMGAANARVNTILDEDTMSSDSEYALATQQSIKAYVDALPVELGIAVSDETTDLTTGTAKTTFRMPYAMTLTDVRASVTTAPTGSILQVDINESGVSVLSTVLSIDASEKTSETAATAAVISDSALADDAEITIDIDQVGSTVAGAGLKIWLIGTRA